MMETEIVNNEKEAQDAVKAAKERALILACVSNAGLPNGKFRLTFLPQEAFKSNDN